MKNKHISLLPLDLRQLELLAADERKLYEELKLAPQKLQLSDPEFMPMFSHALNSHVIPLVRDNPERWLWFTHWLILKEDEARCVGGVGLSGYPDNKGEVMIGYFVDREHEGMGIAGCAVKLLIIRMSDEQALKSVVADIPAGHVASERVVLKNGFRKAGPSEDGFRWIHRIR